MRLSPLHEVSEDKLNPIRDAVIERIVASQSQSSRVIVHRNDALARARKGDRVPAQSAECVQDNVRAAPVRNVRCDLGRRDGEPTRLVEE